MSVLAGDDYLAFCRSLRELSGVDLTQYKRPQMERRLRAFVGRRGISRLTDCIEDLRNDPDQLDALLDRITINVSQLWRNPKLWELVESVILPDLDCAGGELRAWSAGCSYGAEPYTLAAICHLTDRGAKIKIRGTDIDKRMVARARAAIFSDSDARSAPRAKLKAAFDRIEGGWRAKRSLRAMTEFEVGDLLAGRPPSRHYDLILCRNTVIYFSEPIRDEFHARLARALRPGGYLIIGATERVADPTALSLQRTHPLVYRKT